MVLGSLKNFGSGSWERLLILRLADSEINPASKSGDCRPSFFCSFGSETGHPANFDS